MKSRYLFILIAVIFVFCMTTFTASMIEARGGRGGGGRGGSHAAEVSHAAVQQQAVDSPRVQQEEVERAKHHDRKPDGNNLVTEIEIVMIGRNVVMKSGKTARNTLKMHAKIVRTSLMMNWMITMTTIIMAVQPL